MSGLRHFGSETTHHACVDPTPTGMGDTNGVVRMEDDSETVSSEDSERETGLGRPETVGLPGVAWLIDPEHIPPMHLTN